MLIESLHLQLQPLAREHKRRSKLRGMDVVFTSGKRSPDEQLANYRKGRIIIGGAWQVEDPAAIVTFALPERAPHCRGAAYDLCPVVREKLAWERLDLFAELGRIGKELGLVWGGDFQKIKDLCHFELPGWRLLPWPT